MEAVTVVSTISKSSERKGFTMLVVYEPCEWPSRLEAGVWATVTERQTRSCIWSRVCACEVQEFESTLNLNLNLHHLTLETTQACDKAIQKTGLLLDISLNLPNASACYVSRCIKPVVTRSYPDDSRSQPFCQLSVCLQSLWKSAPHIHRELHLLGDWTLH